MYFPLSSEPEPRRRVSRRHGITLVEMLISVTLTLLLMLAVVQVFELMGSGLRRGRATIEMAGQLRSASHRLQQDLDWITVPALPWVDPDAGMGYLELLEGPGSDADPDADGIVGRALDANGDGQPDIVDIDGDSRPDQDSSMGDVDDVLMFTIRSRGEPFVGRIQGQLLSQGDGTVRIDPSVAQEQQIESQVAEVIWWVRYDDLNGDGQRNYREPLMLYRRLLLVRPDLDLSRVGLAENEFFNAYDVSARPNPVGAGMIANSLSDLSLRQNRFAHMRAIRGRPGGLFPYPINVNTLTAKTGIYLGEDVILSDVLAFDLRVYDPQAPIDASGTRVNAALVPGDPGYVVPATAVARGAFVDLNYAKDGSTPLLGSLFSGPSHPWRTGHLWSEFPQTPEGSPANLYDTWPTAYERDGIDQNRNNLIDEGTNGLDDDNVNGVDDAGERETAAPYGVPLRGIQVTIRMMEFNTRQVRQVSVVGDFVPE